MQPFGRSCDVPEDKQDHIVTVAINRDGRKRERVPRGNGSDNSVVANTGISLDSLSGRYI